MADFEVADPGFEALLEHLKHTRNFDFTGYKRTTLMRRVQKRMAEVNVSRFDAYLDYLEVHQAEFRALFNTILINVTSFFRDPAAWDTLRDEVITKLSEEPDRDIRVWSAGCATGEETYTLVMVLAEALGIERFKKIVKVYATDADAEALAIARHARYLTKDLEAVPEELRLKYFEPNDHGWVFRGDLRRCVIFGEHDLVQDAPISKIDLLVCRNVLIYFNSETQNRILGRFHFALNNGGFIFLGKSEMLLTHSRLFEAIDVRARIFKKLVKGVTRDQSLLFGQPRSEDGQRAHTVMDLRDAGFDTGPAAQIIVDRAGAVLLANRQARMRFNITPTDIGRPIQDLEISYRPVEIRSPIEQVYRTRGPIELSNVKFDMPNAEPKFYDVQIAPLNTGARDPIGVSVTFMDVTVHQRLHHELERTSNDVEAAYEELQATNEELETTNEELQSTIEELEATNEELQSTNEELETMNEELNSTNEELETINEELRRRTVELNTVNEFLQGIMTSMRTGVAVLDSDLRVLLWNNKAEDLWGLRPNEAEGKVFTSLDIGLPVAQIEPTLRKCLEDRSELETTDLDAVNRRGRAIRCRVSCTCLVTTDNKPCGLIVQMEETDREQK